MVQIRPVIMTLGVILCVLSVAMLLPAAVDRVDGNPNWRAFAASSLATFFFGGLMWLVGHESRSVRLGLKEGFLLTTLSWLLVAAFGALPFVGMGLSYTDSFFEAMSGVTTTGGTVIVGLDKLPRGVLLWRALLCGLGGVGIIAMAILILPMLRVGGMQLFLTESSDRSEKILPRAIELAAATVGVYVGLILLCIIVFIALGMTPFDAICHGLATVSTAGFSTHDESFGFFKSDAILIAATVFMACGGMPFVFFIRALRGQPETLWRDAQVRGFLSFLAAVSLIMALWLSLTSGRPFLEALVNSAFNVTSIITTSGFASEDYQKWGPFAVGMFFLLTFVGGCSGSTSGGLKIYRLQIAGLLTRSHSIHLLSPHRVITLFYNGRRLPDDVPFSVVAFLAIYMATIGLFTVLLTAMGLDLTTAVSAAAANVGNVGPGLGDMVGPSGNYAAMPMAAKWALSVCMLLGRLELFTVLVLLRPEFWRN